MSKTKTPIQQMMTEIENEHPVTEAAEREKQEAKKRRPSKVYTHLKPREAKEIGSQRKEVRLTIPIIEKLERKAKREKIDLKKYMERVLIKAAAEKDFNTEI